jgi:hypothetical protein
LDGRRIHRVIMRLRQAVVAGVDSGLGAVVEVGLCQDTADVVLDGVAGDEQLPRDLRVSFPLRKEAQYLDFARGWSGEAFAGLARSRGDVSALMKSSIIGMAGGSSDPSPSKRTRLASGIECAKALNGFWPCQDEKRVPHPRPLPSITRSS